MAATIKNNNANWWNLWCSSACKGWTLFLIFFWYWCKDIANLLVWVLLECLITLISNDCITLQQSWNRLVGNYDVYLQAKIPTSFLTSFLRYCKNKANVLCSEIWECLTIFIKIIVSICCKLAWLPVWKKKNPNYSFLFYDIVGKCQTWVIFRRLATSI